MDAKPRGQLTYDEEKHARSIADQTVVLAPIPPLHKPRILIASVIRKPPLVVAALLQTLSWQRLRKPAELSYHFITDFGSGEAAAAPAKVLLDTFAHEHERVKVEHASNDGKDFAEGADSHHWTASAWHRVGALKNRLLQACLDGQYDAVWLVDADVLCDPYTLQSLGDAEVPIVAGVYWTHWRRPQAGDNLVVHAGPQVWLRHPYRLDGHGYTEAEFRAALVSRKLLRVWGLGACTLIHRSAIEKGVSFTPIPEGLPAGPMGDGEDRHFCERARRLHLPLYADSWPDIWHAYHAAEYPDIDRWLGRFASPRPSQPSAEALVSFKLELLEPVPHPENPQVLQHLGPQYVRGRLAQLPVLPEIAEALTGMAPGDRQLLTLHYPVHYEYATLRGQRRMVALTLFDVKLFAQPPTVEHELLSGGGSWRHIDAVTMTGKQMDSLLEEAISVDHDGNVQDLRVGEEKLGGVGATC